MNSFRAEFERAFAAATVHDMFNWLTVIVLVVVEVVTSLASTGYLEYITSKMVDHLTNDNEEAGTGSKPPDFLKVITNPFTKSIIQLDKNILKGWASNNPKYENVSSVMNLHCKDADKQATNCTYAFYGLTSEGKRHN